MGGRMYSAAGNVATGTAEEQLSKEGKGSKARTAEARPMSTPATEEERPAVKLAKEEYIPATVQKTAKLRSDPSTNNPPVATLAAGTQVEVLQTGAAWERIRCKKTGLTGWIRKDLIGR